MYRCIYVYVHTRRYTKSSYSYRLAESNASAGVRFTNPFTLNPLTARAAVDLHAHNIIPSLTAAHVRTFEIH